MRQSVNEAIQQQGVKNCVNREAGIRDTLDKMYGILWGQCYYGINSIIRINKYFKDKSDVSNCLWLLERVKEVTLGLDFKSKKCYNLHEAMLKFLIMIQGQQEICDFSAIVLKSVHRRFLMKE